MFGRVYQGTLRNACLTLCQGGERIVDGIMKHRKGRREAYWQHGGTDSVGYILYCTYRAWTCGECFRVGHRGAVWLCRQYIIWENINLLISTGLSA